MHRHIPNILTILRILLALSGAAALWTSYQWSASGIVPLWLGDPALAARSLAGFAVIAVIFWSGNWVLGRAIRAHIPPIGLSLWRWAGATVILVPVALRSRPSDWHALRDNWKLVALLGSLGGALFQSMVYIGLQSTEATNALLLNATAPLYVIVIAWLVLGSRVNGRQMVGTSI